MNFLERIVKTKLIEVERAKEILPLRELKKIAESSNYNHRSLIDVLKQGDGVKIIAEIKKSSPSVGDLSVDNFDPVVIAKEYEGAGASGISVLTDFEFFGGRKQHLSQVKGNVKVPILRKDFIIDEYQIYETKYIGADAFLLIVKIIDDVQLEDYLSLAKELELDVLVEVFDRHDIARALKVSPYPRLIGINNRDLETFKVDINRSIELCGILPDDVVKVSESGINSREDVERISDAGFDAVLVGEALMRAKDKTRKIFELLSKN
ncbi:indole-3-glycerol phosphate synthase [Candidatus Kryptonium thompsonii]|uniref:Indole-3-glycerol phosphate synthase n=1 Tax=Candidatus Kryptonium thompsonii TaxID=1633631 RepID=A0A0P1LLF6_9BACT|nr:indole-3-glycerol phosphate synthase TrpC [Candidatus Kryptonium thompsoni]CUS82432.1 indole-3-glycerol phosphate synthase [Candidatus Kryptonium thompsoni]CUS83082.1 indole-3-glycerol phosphate synthase [Candidatus Kryptonium thompsoni]CUS88620.1 indole-3-glycerol phosphate synthase [Candidatus Kryptonium thompsoni]CUS91631.1 indole-3-glycerol phosphate synthase [Candidatus Kryptonium thompsoni]CUS92284.1 indole-3-glycerol phosphate synthase [Candidatus Kryptonium thompsoni]